MPTNSVTPAGTARDLAELGDWVRNPNNRANCVGQGLTHPEVDVWHHEPETSDPDARRAYTARVGRACHGCPMRTGCLVYALATEQTEGVMPGAYGGLPSWERDGLIRRARANGHEVVNAAMARALLQNSTRTRAPARAHQPAQGSTVEVSR